MLRRAGRRARRGGHVQPTKRGGEVLRRKAFGKCMLGLALGAVVGAATATTALASAVPNPAVEGPIQGGVHGYPWNHSVFPLSAAKYSYTENEYFYSGSATNLAKG